MDSGSTNWTLGKIAATLGGELRGSPNQPISRPVPADTPEPEGITFAGSRNYLEAAERSGVGAVLLKAELLPTTLPCILVENPRAAFGRLLSMWKRPLPLNPGVHEKASVHPEARIDPTAQVGPFAVVEKGAQIGPRAKIYAFAYVGEECVVGEDCVVYPHAVLYQQVTLGDRTVVHSGAIIGADGFGFDYDGERQIKVPQIGTVEIGADSEIGANACIDRATAGTTRLDSDVKIDNLVQVGHNVSIGKSSVIAAQTGLSGSTEIGAHVTMGGSCATSHHVKIADGVVMGGRTGATSDIETPGEYWGMPARPIREAIRASLLVYKLPEIMARLKELEARLKDGEGE